MKVPSSAVFTGFVTTMRDVKSPSVESMAVAPASVYGAPTVMLTDGAPSKVMVGGVSSRLTGGVVGVGFGADGTG